MLDRWSSRQASATGSSRSASRCPTIVVLFLDRPAVVPEIADAAAALLVEFGARDDAIVDVLLGEAQARGRLPFDLPSSTEAVARQSQRRPVRHGRTTLPIRAGLVD